MKWAWSEEQLKSQPWSGDKEDNAVRCVLSPAQTFMGSKDLRFTAKELAY